MTSVIESAAKIRLKAIQDTSDLKRNALAQHLTPPETARLAVSMFTGLNADQQFIRCLDLGAGTGMLSMALYDRYDGHIERLDAVELDDTLALIYEAEMASIGIPHKLYLGDALTSTPEKEYDRVILNPPYKKMPAGDERQALLPCKAPNLYSAFVSIGLSRLAKGGELVAIVPRSWMNGDYFTAFRRYALGRFSLDAIHIYGSRAEVFAETNVLQETVLVRFSNRPQADSIRVSHSVGKGDEIRAAEYRARDLIEPNTLVVRIAPKSNMLGMSSLAEAGLCPSTGKVVDFRNKESIFEERPAEDNAYPLMYSGNFVNGHVEHPREIGKPQWYVVNDDKLMRQLTQAGSYVVVKRFSSKEERRRVVAFPLLLKEPAALENHLNFIHAGTPRQVIPLESKELAQGLALWLNSTFVDEWFRDVSGSTQVNAKDIRAMPSPPLECLVKLGGLWRPNMDQDEIDRICEGVR